MRSPFVRVLVLLALGGAVAVACTIGGEDGDRCNPLVERDECQGTARCTAFSCTESYCCSTDKKSSDPHCNGAGCPDEDASDDGGVETGGDDGGKDAGNDDADAAADADGDAPD